MFLGVTMWTCGEENEINSNKQTNYQSIHVPHTVSDMEPGEWVNMSTFNASELTHAAPHSSCWKESVLENIPCMLVTRDTSQLDRSWLNEAASRNIATWKRGWMGAWVCECLRATMRTCRGENRSKSHQQTNH